MQNRIQRQPIRHPLPPDILRLRQLPRRAAAAQFLQRKLIQILAIMMKMIIHRVRPALCLHEATLASLRKTEKQVRLVKEGPIGRLFNLRLRHPSYLPGLSGYERRRSRSLDPADETAFLPCKTPVIVNFYDGYMFGANDYDLALDMEEAFEKICEMSCCHQSQIAEWVPWVGHNMAPPKSFSEWRPILRKRFERKNSQLGIQTITAVEVFTVTACGEIPAYEQILNDFPSLLAEASSLPSLKERLLRWRPA